MSNEERRPDLELIHFVSDLLRKGTSFAHPSSYPARLVQIAVHLADTADCLINKEDDCNLATSECSGDIDRYINHTWVNLQSHSSSSPPPLFAAFQSESNPRRGLIAGTNDTNSNCGHRRNKRHGHGSPSGRKTRTRSSQDFLRMSEELYTANLQMDSFPSLMLTPSRTSGSNSQAP